MFDVFTSCISFCETCVVYSLACFFTAISSQTRCLCGRLRTSQSQSERVSGVSRQFRRDPTSATRRHVLWRTIGTYLDHFGPVGPTLPSKLTQHPSTNQQIDMFEVQRFTAKRLKYCAGFTSSTSSRRSLSVVATIALQFQCKFDIIW